MKKLVLFTLVCSSIVFFGFNLNFELDCATSESGSRSLTCGSCHGGSINTDIIITDGLEDENDDNGDKYYNIEILMPLNISVASIQTNLNSDKKGKFSALLNSVRPLFIDGYGTQYALMDLKDSKEGKKDVDPLVFKWYPPENFAGTQNIIVEGVFANLDGTTSGDYSFYKEVSINVKTANEAFKIYPTIVNDVLNIKGLKENSIVQIIDFAGKNILNQKLSNQKMDLSNLPAGNYILKVEDKVEKFLKL